MRKLISFFILLLSSLTSLLGQVRSNGAVYYVRQAAPWSQSQSETLDQAFGTGNYTVTDYSLAATVLFAREVAMVYLEGSNFRNPAALNAYLASNQTLIENWVTAGGRLFINAAPNEGGNLNLGFGGVSLRYPAVSYLAAIAGGQAGHPIFNGPRKPVGTNWFGMFFAHGAITGRGLIPLLTGDSGIILAELRQGAGVVFFSSLTTPTYQSPVAEATNLRINMLHYLKSVDLRETYYADADGDGFGNAADPVKSFTAPVGYVRQSGDCADTEAAVFPGAREVCDNLDNNCDGQVDEGVSSWYYADADGDGFGNASAAVRACERPAGYVIRAGDCQDADATTYPGAPEACDGIDHNCDGIINRDVKAPVLISPGASLPDVVAECAATVTVIPFALDNCAGLIAGTTHDPLNYTAQGTYFITWRFNDGHGNESTVRQKVIIKDREAPVIKTNGNQLVSNEQGLCAAVVPVQAWAADNCGVGMPAGQRSDGLGLRHPYPVGTTTITWRVTDVNGNPAEPVTQIIIVADTEWPVVLAPANQVICYSPLYALPPLVARDNCGIAAITYQVSGATTRSGTGPDASGTFGPGANTVTWTVADARGHAVTAVTTITVNPQPLVTIPEAFAFHKGVSANTIYPGYLPASRLALPARAAGGSGPYTYLWSTGEITPDITVTRGGTYGVTITDSKGCIATFTTAVGEINVGAGGNGKVKEGVLICHNGQTLAIAQSAVAAHLAHGCALGSCQSAGANTRTTIVNPTLQNLGLTVYPNPATAYTNIEFTLYREENFQLALYDLKGAQVQEIARGTGDSGRFFSYEISTAAYPAGVYLIRLTTDKVVYNKRLLINK